MTEGSRVLEKKVNETQASKTTFSHLNTLSGNMDSHDDNSKCVFESHYQWSFSVSDSYLSSPFPKLLNY